MISILYIKAIRGCGDIIRYVYLDEMSIVMQGAVKNAQPQNAACGDTVRDVVTETVPRLG